MKDKVLGTIAGAMVLLFWVTLGFADPAGFHTTADEMVRELTRKPQKYRTLFPKTRTIVVMEATADTVSMENVVVDNTMDIPKVRAKVLFDFDSANVRADSYSLLDEVGLALNASQLENQDIVITGHADSDGEDSYNLRLSFERAHAVRGYLVKACEVRAERFTVRGFGESLPLVEEIDAEAKQQNRRVEFEISR